MLDAGKPSISALEKAYVRGLREGERRGRARFDFRTAQFNELVIRYKAAVGELRRLKQSPAVKEWFADHDSVLISKHDYNTLLATQARMLAGPVDD